LGNQEPETKVVEVVQIIWEVDMEETEHSYRPKLILISSVGRLVPVIVSVVPE